MKNLEQLQQLQFQQKLLEDGILSQEEFVSEINCSAIFE